MEDIKTNSLTNMECGMAYLAHPYTPLNRRAEIFVGAIKAENVEEAGDIALKIMKKYLNLTIISPLHNYSFLEGNYEKETEILKYDFRLLSRCDILILSGNWRNSKGCMSEYGYAKAKGIRIYEYRDNLLYPLE